MFLSDLNRYMKFLQPITMSLAIRGNFVRGKCSALTQRFFENIKTLCNQLKELVIEEYYINGDKVHFNIKGFIIYIFKIHLLHINI